MSSNKFLTTRATTLAGLAAVAYGNSSFFFFVQDQIRGAHSMYDLHRSRPSSLLLDMLGSREVFIEYASKIASESDLYFELEKLYPQIITAPTDFSEIFLRVFLRELDNLTQYSVFVRQFFRECLEQALLEISFGQYALLNYDYVDSFLLGLREEIGDIKYLEDILLIILDNPSTKINAAPADKILKLKRGLSTEYNHKGLTKARVEIPISQWEQNFVYRDMRGFQPSMINVVITENYDGYSLESVLSPEITNGLGTTVVGATWDSSSYEFPQASNRRLSPEEQRIMNFDLVNSQTGLVEV